MTSITAQDSSAPTHPLSDIGKPVPDGTLAMLVRYPGPCGIRDYFAGRLKTPASPGDRLCQFRLRPYPDFVAGIRRFGFLAFTRPARYQLVESDSGILWGLNSPTPAHEILWIPPLLAERALSLEDRVIQLSLSDWIGDEDLPIFRNEANRVQAEIERHFAEVSMTRTSSANTSPHPEQRPQAIREASLGST